MGEVFMKQYGPRIINLIGSSAVNPDSKTEVLGTADKGLKVTLYKINSLDKTNIELLNLYYFRTMHHEFAHILHQTKNYPTEFNEISVSNYSPTGWMNRTNEQAQRMGFVGNYASSEAREDFVEVIANYLTEGLDKNALDELKTWIAASAENQQYFIRQREIWFSAVSREAASVYDKDKAFENFRNRVESQKEIQSTSRRGFSLSALWRYAAVVAIIIAVGCISYWQGEVNVKDTFADISVEAPLGSKTKLYLPDGTLVWLNAGSRMTYSQGFGVDNRKVELEGEGYFEVKRNEKIPFFVKTKDLQLQVLGTKFNFRDYPEDHEVVVSLLEGKVGLNNLLREEKEAVLSPDERAVLNKANGLSTVESVTA